MSYGQKDRHPEPKINRKDYSMVMIKSNSQPDGSLNLKESFLQAKFSRPRARSPQSFSAGQNHHRTSLSLHKIHLCRFFLQSRKRPKPNNAAKVHEQRVNNPKEDDSQYVAEEHKYTKFFLFCLDMVLKGNLSP